MKINPVNNPNILRSYTKNQAAPVQKTTAKSGMDEVSFSQEALSFAKTMAEVRESMAPQAPASADRQEKLNALSERIRSGQYQVSGEDVAEKMVADILGRYQD